MTLSPADAFRIRNTLGVISHARQGVRITDTEQLSAALAQCRADKLRWVPLGAGSNIVPLSDVDAFVGQIEVKGIQLREELADQVVVQVGAGEDWHAWVMHALAQGWYGLENLVRIPGSVGAAPIQNIGAYGVEVSQFIASVECMNLDGEAIVLDRAECRFSYRNSIFKQRPDLTVTSVNFTLLKRANPVATYPDVRAVLAQQGLTTPSADELAKVISDIRQAKLPDPAVHGNAGSFFKNPIVAAATATRLATELAGLVTYDVPQPDRVKLSAAQLIDSLGWKDHDDPDLYCWPRQALVLVNRSAERGEDVIDFAAQIQRSVQSNYGVELELEPVVLS